MIGTAGEAWPGIGSIPANAGRKVYFANNSVTIGAGTIPAGTQVVLVANGTITITGNITYANSYSSSGAISSLWLVAQGDINIQENVSTIYAFLVAQGTSGSPGRIQTCVRTGMSTTYNPLTNAVCTVALSIFGALRADSIYWQRTSSTVGTGGTPAETVEFDPGLYLSSPFSSTAIDSDIQDSRDLPPVY